MPAESGFQLDPRLAADTIAVTALRLCDVLLMNDAVYPWLILVPRRADTAEIIDLTPAEQRLLTAEIARSAHVLRAVCGADKLNIGALGNMVRQLHIHIIARFRDDAAWPNPVWGRAPATPYVTAEADRLVGLLRASLATENRH